MGKLVHRKPAGKSFTYRYGDGRTVKNQKLRAWFSTLAIPPAWTDVVIDLDRDAKVHAWGRDNKGRKQYIYNSDWTSATNAAKYQRILRFAEQLASMRRVTARHIRRHPIDEKAVLACMTRMLDEAFFRPGNETYSRNNKTYGLTTLRTSHMRVEKHKVVFSYVGKSHQQQQREICDAEVKRVLKELEPMKGYDLFDITLADGSRKKLTSQDLNQYIAEVMGEDFTAKDFRTWAGTVLTAVALEDFGPVDDVRHCQRNILAAVRAVAKNLGNTPSVCRENYIHPQVLSHYQAGRTLTHFRQQLQRRPSKLITADEKATIKLLSHLEQEDVPEAPVNYTHKTDKRT